jgi:hypothetical protein
MLKWAGYIAGKGETKNVIRILVEKPPGDRLFERDET